MNSPDRLSPDGIYTATLLSVKEAAAYLHMSPSWVYQTLRKFCLARKFGRKVKYLKEDLDRYIEQSATLWTDLHTNKSLVAIKVDNGKTLPHKK